MTDKNDPSVNTSAPLDLNAGGVNTKGINPSADPLTQIQMAYIMLTTGTDEQKLEAVNFFSSQLDKNKPAAFVDSVGKTVEEITESLEAYVRKSYNDVPAYKRQSLALSLLRAIETTFNTSIKDMVSMMGSVTPKAFVSAFTVGEQGCKILINPEWITYHKSLLKDYDQPNVDLALSIVIVKRIKEDLLGFEEGDRYNYNPILFPDQGEPVVHLSGKTEKTLEYLLKCKANKFLNPPCRE